MVKETLGLIPGFDEPLLVVIDGAHKKVLTLDGATLQAEQAMCVKEVREVTQSEFFSEVSVCPLCGRSNGAPIGQVQQLFWKVSLVRCSCGLVRKRQFALPNVLTSIYCESYSNFKASDSSTAITATMPRVARLPVRGGRLLDVGCGSGVFVMAARAAGFDAYGIDPFLPEDASNIDGLKKLSIFEAAHEESLGKFDVVTLWAVWEHLERPLDVLMSARSLLKPGGSLILNSPAGDSLHARLRAGEWYMATLVEHLHFLTHQAVHELAQHLQLTPSGVRSAGVPFPLGGRGRGRLGQGLTIGALNKIFKLDGGVSSSNADLTTDVPAAHQQRQTRQGVGKRLAGHPLAGEVLRCVLDKARVGDHIEITLRST